jgi:hypothetical protein
MELFTSSQDFLADTSSVRLAARLVTGFPVSHYHGLALSSAKDGRWIKSFTTISITKTELLAAYGSFEMTLRGALLWLLYIILVNRGSVRLLIF